MGFSTKAAVLTVSNIRSYYSYSRSLNFRATKDSLLTTPTIDCLLAFEGKFGGTIVNPLLFDQYLNLFKNKIDSYKGLDLTDKMVLVQIPFAVTGEEEFFIDNIYRSGQKKLFERLVEKTDKALNRLTYENILICTAGIAEYVVLYK